MSRATAQGGLRSLADRLRSLLVAGLHQAHRLRRPVLVSAASPVPAADPLAFFERGVRESRDRLFWSGPRGAPTLAGVGAAWTLVCDGAGRFQDAARTWRDLALGVLTQSGEEVAPTGPILLGGFSFDPARPTTGAWEGYPDGLLVLPRLLLTDAGRGMWVTANVVVGPDARTDLALDQVLSLATRLLADSREDGRMPCPRVEEVQDVMSAARWKEIVGSALGELERGGLEKVVLARSCRVRGASDFSPAAVLRRLRAEYPNCFVYAVARGDRCFLGASPEQLVSLYRGEISAMCLAGSIARGGTKEEDLRLGTALVLSAKERAEHAVVVRALHEALADLGADVPNSGEPELVKFPNVQHLLTKVSGRLAPGRTVLDVVERLHPTPAVGGYPREDALRLIRQREDLDRGWYAGPVGWLDTRGDGEFAAALRCALLQGKEATLFAGCGIVAGSDPESEYAESCLKLLPVLSALKGETP